MILHTCPLEGLAIIEHQRWDDERGFFTETYNRLAFEQAGIGADFVQDNLSMSHRGVLRGMHAQSGAQQQGKLVRVLRGRVWDVAVDIRVGSPSFGQHYSLELSADSAVSFWIPPGFLHGFLALEDDTIFTYKVTGFYDPAGEVGVRWDDPGLDIKWPELSEPYLISKKDAVLPLLSDMASPFTF